LREVSQRGLTEFVDEYLMFTAPAALNRSGYR
jgi:hypothetical protein